MQAIDKALLTLTEAAVALGISRQAVHQAVQRDRLHPIRRFGLLLFEAADVERYKQDHSRQKKDRER